MDDKSTSNLFSDVKFVIAECQDADETKNLLIENGAKHINYLSEHVTLVISDVTCLEADEAMNIFEKPIVSSLWVHLSLKAKRLLPPEAFCPYRNIFLNIVASFSSELSHKDTGVLACTLTYYGARVSKNISDCTHFIVPRSDAKDLPSEKSGLNIVAPDWILESVKQNACCNEELFEPSLLLPPPPPRPPTPPSAPKQEPEPPKTNVPSERAADNNSLHTEYVVNPNQYQTQSSVRGARPREPTPHVQIHHNQSPSQQQPLRQPHHVSPDMIRHEGQPSVNHQHQQMMLQNRHSANLQRTPHPRAQRQSPSQLQARFQSQSQPPLPTSLGQHPHSHHQVQIQQQQHPQNQPQHYQHSHQHQQSHQQPHQIGHPNQVVMQVRPQSQPGTIHRMVRPVSAASNHLIDQKQNNVRPPHQAQMASIRHQQPDQMPYENFNSPNQRRPEYSGPQTQYQPQPHPRVRQPYSPVLQQTQAHQVQASMHHAPLSSQQHMTNDVIQSEVLSQSNLQQPTQVLQQARPMSNLQHHPHSQLQSQPQQQSQPIVQHQQNLQNQHHHHQQHNHPAQSVMQMRPQSQVGITHQTVRTHTPNYMIDQKQSTMSPMHTQQMSNLRQSQPDHVPYGSFNQTNYTGDPQQYQPHPRLTQTYQQPPQPSQIRSNQSPIHHPQLAQQRQMSPERIQSEVTPHHCIQQQAQHLTHNQAQHSHLRSPAQVSAPPRPQMQPGSSHLTMRPHSLGLPNHEQKQNNLRPMHSQQVINIQVNNPISQEEITQPKPYPSIFDHPNESNLAVIKSKVPIVNESVQYFGHDQKQIVPKNQPLHGCKFKLVEYDVIDQELRDAWQRNVTDAGGTYCNDLIEATHLVCETRKSTEYHQAMRLGVRCVTIYWVNDILALGRLTHPWKALHLPHAFGLDERPLIDQIITVTNFRGNERRVVREMILKTGAKYTDYFSSKNTLIICGAVGGDKYDRAIEWRIPLANCQLLSDILLFGVVNIGQLLAQTKYQNFARKDPFRLVSDPGIRKLLLPWTKPIPLTETKTSLEPSTNGDSGDIGTTCPSNPSKLDSGQVKPDIRINGSELDVIIKSEDKHGSESNIIPTEVEEPTGETSELKVEFRQPKDLVNSDGHKSDEKENNICSPKLPRKSQKPIRLLYTNIRSELVDPMKEAATKFGLCFVSNPKDCTHLLVEQLCRTQKFICAFSHARYILNPAWLLESSEAGELLDEKPFIVQDKEGEEKYSFNLIHSLVKRKKRSEPLFHNWVFFITPSVRKDMPDIDGMIESAGGCVCTKKPPSKRQLDQLKSNGKRMVVVSCDEDYYLCSSVELCGTEVVGPEFVISGILRQDIDLDVHRVRKKPRMEYN